MNHVPIYHTEVFDLGPGRLRDYNEKTERLADPLLGP